MKLSPCKVSKFSGDEESKIGRRRKDKFNQISVLAHCAEMLKSNIKTSSGRLSFSLVPNFVGFDLSDNAIVWDKWTNQEITLPM